MTQLRIGSTRLLAGGALVALLTGALLVARAGEAGANRGLPEGGELFPLNPAEFTTEGNNPYFPLRVGSRAVFRETDKHGARQKVVVTTTNRTKLIANGVTARVVHDVVTEDGVFVEVTDDWFAQDSKGNVWYFGEATTL